MRSLILTPALMLTLLAGGCDESQVRQFCQQIEQQRQQNAELIEANRRLAHFLGALITFAKDITHRKVPGGDQDHSKLA